jgi:hypothetical protein
MAVVFQYTRHGIQDPQVDTGQEVPRNFAVQN